MAHPLDGIEAKIKRGFHHLGKFEAKARAFLNDDPYEVVHVPAPPDPDINPDSSWYLGVFHVRKEPPLLLGIIGGEAIGQFRAALDHLMTMLVRLDHPSTDKTPNFPIYPADVWQPPSGKPGPRGEIVGLVRPEHLTILDRLQPDASGGGPAWPRGPVQDVLSIIQWLTNMDKHEMIHAVYAFPKRVVFHGHPNVSAYVGILGPPYALEEGTEIYRVLFVDDSEMEVPLDVAVSLPLGPPRLARFDTDVLWGYGTRVREIVEDFRAVTPEWR